MIAIDTSALLAILFGEGERDRFRGMLDKAGGAVVSAGTLIEARMVVRGRSGDDMVAILDSLIDEMGILVMPVTAAHVVLAHSAFIQYGKGSGHPARLNFGDLFSYALAKEHGVPLLYKGDDFDRTDIVAA